LNDYVTVTTVVEHAFCPKFTYYGHVLGLMQYEEKRGTVQTGKILHKKRETTNKDYVIHGLRGKKLVALKLYSRQLPLIGKIDEAVELDDEIVIIEHKFSNPIVGNTIKVQLGLLAVLLEENLKKPIRRAIVVFTKENRVELEVKIDEELKRMSTRMFNDVLSVINSGKNPKSKFDGRCLNCCYRRVCPVGSLKISE
jgi:CRISPR-associated exonuclease Cas4